MLPRQSVAFLGQGVALLRERVAFLGECVAFLGQFVALFRQQRPCSWKILTDWPVISHALPDGLQHFARKTLDIHGYTFNI